MTAPETDLVGTVRAGKAPGTVLVKVGHGIWSSLGGPHSGCHTFPSARVVADKHPVIGMVPGLEPDESGVAAWRDVAGDVWSVIQEEGTYKGFLRCETGNWVRDKPWVEERFGPLTPADGGAPCPAS